MGDPNFDRTVVLLLATGAEGALGLVLNRPTEADVAGALPEWAAAACEPRVVFQGGPVALTSALCLARPRFPHPAVDPAVGVVGTLDLTADPATTAPGLAGLRVFVGYAGWGAEQLVAEIAAGAWWVLGAEEDDLLSDEPDLLWRRVLGRQPGLRRAFANAPDDLSWN